jgi:hypothetical protein
MDVSGQLHVPAGLMQGILVFLNRVLGVHQTLSGHCREEKIFFPTRIWTPHHPSHRIDSTLSMLPSLAKCHPRTGHEVLPLATLPPNGKPVCLYALTYNYRTTYSAVILNSDTDLSNLLVALNLMSKASASIYTTEECQGSLASTILKQ